jgi:predicted RNA methylase
MRKIQLSSEVETVLRNSRIENNALFLPPGNLDRKLYVEVNKAIEAAGGKWNKSSKSHVFPSEPTKLLFAIENGEIEKLVTKKQALQQFFTPPDLAEYVVELADVEGKVVLEPSAGAGALALECLKQNADYVSCVELDEDTAKQLEKNLNQFNNHGSYEVQQADFLLLDPNDFKGIEIAVLNPPFTKNQDCKHVEHAYKFLNSEGKLVAIMANNQTREPFKDLIKGKRYEIEELEVGRFKSSGTMVSTLILTLWK